MKNSIYASLVVAASLLTITSAARSYFPSKYRAFFTTGDVSVRQAPSAPESHVGDGAWHVSTVNDHSLGKCRAGDVIEVSFTGSWTASAQSEMHVVVFDDEHDPDTMTIIESTTVRTFGTIQYPLGTSFAVHGAHVVERSGDCRFALRYFASEGATMSVNYTASEADSGGTFMAVRRIVPPLP